MVRERIPARFGLDPLRDVQVLTPMNRFELGARNLNAQLQAVLNPPRSGPVTATSLKRGQTPSRGAWESREPVGGQTPFQTGSGDGAEINRFGWTYRPGDKVLQTVNNYQKEVFNGDIGRVRDIDVVEQELTVEFEGREVAYDFGEVDELALAFAMTIHKSQGSEYPAVIIPLHTQHFMMLQRNLIYTGITRGKRLVVVVGSRKALSMAVERHDTARRCTALTRRLGQDKL
jgi:exodeoxyribonuclease V alpha subunit